MSRKVAPGTATDLPRQIGPYRLENRIGVGGMGEVYRAWDQRLERWVAAKQILTDENADAKGRDRLRREARTVASLSHPAIVQIHDILDFEDGDWIIMELIEGQTLHSMLQEGPLQVSQALYLALEIAGGLAEAHEKGVVHRDLKTENVMVTPGGHAKILDFGLAKRLWPDDSEASLSVQGTILGTGRAMSPEQVLGEDIDHRSDLFSFGTLLFEMTTGERPFVGSSLVLTLAQVCSEVHPPAREINPDLPEELSQLIDRLLEKEPDRRPENAAQVATLLSEIGGIPLPEPGALREVEKPRLPEHTPTAVAAAALRPVARSLVSHESSSGISTKTLVKTRLVAVERIRERLGDSDAYDFFDRHDRLARDLLSRLEGLEVDRLADGFLLLFDRPLDAVRFGTEYQEELAILADVMELDLEARVGVHLGEVRLSESSGSDLARGARPLTVEGAARDAVERLTALARPGQTLVSEEATHIAQRALETSDESTGQPLDWIELGVYDFGEGHQTLEIFEVVAEGQDAHPAPDDPEIAHRLGSLWPAVGNRSPWIGVLTAILVAATLGVLATVGWWLRIEPGGVGREDVVPSVAVLGFQNLGQVEDEWMAASLAELINSHLQAGNTLRLIPRQSVARAYLELDLKVSETLAEDTLAAIRRNLGNDFVVLGSLVVLPQGEDRRLSLQLYVQDTRDATSVRSWSFEGTGSELLELGLEAGQALRDHLGVVVDPADPVTARQALPEGRAATEHYVQGLEALRRFDASSARRDLLATIELEPDFAPAHAALAQTWRYLGYDTKALESATRAFELSQGMPRVEALWIEGQFCEVQGDWERAIQVFQTLAELFPQDIENLLHLAEAQNGAGHGEQALAILAELRQLPAPLNEDPRIDLATVESNLVLGRYSEALSAARDAIAKAATRQSWVLGAEARRLEGVALFQLADYNGARAAYSEARRLFSEADDLGKEAQVMTNIANLLVHEGRMEEAEVLYREALDLHLQIGSRKWLADVQNGLAYMMQAQGDLEGATQLLGETLDLVRDSGDRQRETIYLDTLAWVLLQQGRWDEAESRALENLELANHLDLPERSSWAHFYLGRVAFVEGRLDEAQARYAQALALSEQIDYAGIAGYVLRSQVEVSIYRGRLREAEKQVADLRIAGSVFGEDVEALTQQTRAQLALELGRPAEAVDLADRAYQDLAAAGRRDEAAAAGLVVVRALVDQQRHADGRRRLEELAPLSQSSLNPWVQIGYELAQARLEIAEGRTSEATGRLRRTSTDADAMGVVPLALEARWLLSLVDPESDPRGLAVEADDLGFGFIRRQIDRRPVATGPAAVDG